MIMNTEIFKRFDNWDKQRDVALSMLNRLRSLHQVEYPCLDYASAKQLAHVLQSSDRERLCQTIHVFSNFVRVVRNEKGSFGFACVVFDHTAFGLSVSGG